MSPLERGEDIASVEALEASHGPAVARVTFRPVAGLTVAWVRRVVDCHLARNAALGHDVPEMRDCPLVPRNAVAKVWAWGTSVSVDIGSDDPAAAREIFVRALRLTARIRRMTPATTK